jgi:hypothetical protein
VEKFQVRLLILHCLCGTTLEFNVVVPVYLLSSPSWVVISRCLCERTLAVEVVVRAYSHNSPSQVASFAQGKSKNV